MKASPFPGLQAIVDEAYVRGRYETLDPTIELDPPLSPEDASWAQTLQTDLK